MVKVFTDCSERTILKFEKLLQVENLSGEKTIELDLEAEFSSLALDIIGLGVFNYDFGSVTKESPVIKVHPPDLVLPIFLLRNAILLCCCIPLIAYAYHLLFFFFLVTVAIYVKRCASHKQIGKTIFFFLYFFQ